MSSGPTNLFDLAQALLTAAVGIFNVNGVPPPGVQFVYGVGDPPATDDMLAVSWVGVGPGSPGSPEQPMITQQYGLVMPRRANLQLWCLRGLTYGSGVGLELTDITQANIDQISFDAQAVMTDAYILTKGIVTAHYAGDFKTFADGLAVGTCLPVHGGGQVGGMVLPIEAELS